MKIVIAIDSFKGSLSSTEAGSAAAKGIRRVIPDAEISVFPVADGGEGTAEALTTGLHGTLRHAVVPDPLGRPVTAAYGILPDRTAVIEMAAASGLPLLSPAERNPMHTTTEGFGMLVRDAAAQGCRRFLLGLGGSATNDGGIGFLQALGFSLTGADGLPVPPGAAGLAMLRHISPESTLRELSGCSFHIACDVNNPLCGETGCSAVFAPQKGADAAMVTEMEQSMRHYAELVKSVFPDADPDAPGAGAAGGLGFAIRTFLHGNCESGAALVMRMTGLEQAISGADLVITGEGCIDAQTAMGKAPAVIAQTAKRSGIPVIAFCGIAGTGASECTACGIDAFFPVLRRITSPENAMHPETAAQNLADTAEQVFRLTEALTRRNL